MTIHIDNLGRAENSRNTLKVGVCGTAELVIGAPSLYLITKVGKLRFHQPRQKAEEKHNQKQDN